MKNLRIRNCTKLSCNAQCFQGLYWHWFSLLKRSALFLSLYILILLFSLPANAWLEGESNYEVDLSLQLKGFTESRTDIPYQSYSSVATELSYSKSLSGGEELFAASLFLRSDERDSERNYLDIQELSWSRFGSNWETQVGYAIVNWGVNDIFNISDTINAKILLEAPRLRKSGQPMMRYSFTLADQLFDLYLLYDLNPVEYPGQEGRLRYPILVDDEAAEFNRGKSGRVDAAVRWSFPLSAVDFAVSHFYGISREPYFIFNYDFDHPRLIPVYEKVNRTSVEAITNFNGVTIRGEWVHQYGALEELNIFAGGGEYTWDNVNQWGIDVTAILEGVYDTRTTTTPNFFDQDIALAWRVAFNDKNDSNLYLATIVDTRYTEAVALLGWSNNFAQNWKLSVTGSFFYSQEKSAIPAEFETNIVDILNAIAAGQLPLNSTDINTLRGLIDGRAVPRRELTNFLDFIEQLQQPGYIQTLNTETLPQILFDLSRINDPSQKINLLERDNTILIDVNYLF